MSIDPGSINRPRCGWVVHYVDQRIIVTSWYAETPGGRYPMAELGDVLRVVGRPHPGRWIALAAGGVEVAVALPFAVAYHSAAMVLAGLIAAAGVATGVLTDARRNPRWMQLWAPHRGAAVLLYSTRDRAEFERVRRALIRAREANRGPLP